MGLRYLLAANVTPIFLRLALGIVFIWAGYAKTFYYEPFEGEKAATLANAGVIEGPATPTPPGTGNQPPSEDGTTDGNGDEASPDDDQDGEDAGTGTSTGSLTPSGASIIPARLQETGSGEGESAEPVNGADSSTGSSQAQASGRWTAADFENPVEVRRLFSLVLTMKEAEGNGQWPGFLSSNTVMKTLAWAVALTELIGGFFILVGLLTRLASVGVAGIMIGALWMTQIGPWIGEADAFLGFLPPHKLAEPGFAYADAWTTLMFQFTLLCAALGVLFAGPGSLSIDGIIFREKKERPDTED